MVGGLNGRWYAGIGRETMGAGGDGGYSSEMLMYGEDTVEKVLDAYREWTEVESAAGE